MLNAGTVFAAQLDAQPFTAAAAACVAGRSLAMSPCGSSCCGSSLTIGPLQVQSRRLQHRLSERLSERLSCCPGWQTGGCIQALSLGAKRHPRHTNWASIAKPLLTNQIWGQRVCSSRQLTWICYSRMRGLAESDSMVWLCLQLELFGGSHGSVGVKVGLHVWHLR